MDNLLKDIHSIVIIIIINTMKAKQNISGLELAYKMPDLCIRGIAFVWEGVLLDNSFLLIPL